MPSTLRPSPNESPSISAMPESALAGVFIPDRICALGAIASNLSWSWSRSAREMFRRIDPTLWTASRENPLTLLRLAAPERLAACTRDPRFLELYDREVERLERERSYDHTWFAQNYPELLACPVAYFCAEFALHTSVPIYSGGLGVLAGDHCKSASDLGVPFVGVGLLYTDGYFDQRIRADGWQEERDDLLAAHDNPLETLLNAEGGRSLAVVPTFGRDVHVGASRLIVGRTTLYLLTTDLAENHPDDRTVTHQLYAGGAELRLRQEWILGVGGVRVLRALGIEPAAWHANEGHAAFMMVERVRELIVSGARPEDAVRQVREAGIFTTHTPVAAGHDVFPADQVAACAGPIWEEMGVTEEELLAIGRDHSRPAGTFDMTATAIRLSARINGVAAKHAVVTRMMSRDFWPDRSPEQVPIGYVTNGVHLATWMSDPVRALLDEKLGDNWEDARDVRDEPAVWDEMLSLDSGTLWAAHEFNKRRLHHALRDTARREWAMRAGDAVAASAAPAAVVPEGGDDADDARRRELESLRVATGGVLLDPRAFTIGFARRFATYKRAALIFRDLDRLRRLVTDPHRPVQIVFSGKAHPADVPGKRVLQAVYDFAKDPALEGRIAFVEDYDLAIAGRLVHGVDLWLNLPRVPLEASGTSGMKAALNGVPQLSTLDGWWPEAYNGLNGWAIPLPPAGLSEEDVDAADAEQVYSLLEREIVPLFYQRDERGIPTAWIARMKQAICVAGQKFTTRRMVQEYVMEYYAPAMRTASGAPLEPPDEPPTA
ncbi:MAG: alpha-glucan family phosphorylase [Thermomicrobia bacterium]|nr:alpha-glucan family phosphorylase [Thermomicrobia bacterium]